MPNLLPFNPNSEHLQKEAKDLLTCCKACDVDAIQCVRQSLSTFRFQSNSQIAVNVKLSHAQDTVARAYGFANWPSLVAYATVEHTNYQTMNRAVADGRMEEFEFRCGVARSKGLPEIGTSRVSEYGVRYDVTDYAPALTPYGANRIRIGGSLIQIDDLLPIISFPEMSDRLHALYLETDSVTARPLLFLDTMPDRYPRHGGPGMHQVTAPAGAAPYYFLLDAARIDETILAHEIGHVWVEMVEQIEDFRNLKDQSDLTRTTQFQHIQSFVMDLPVNDMLERRGFDMSIIAAHELEAIHNIAANCARGEKPANKRILAGVISSLAGSLLEMERFPKRLSESIKNCLELIERHLPEVFEPSKEFVRSVLRHGYEDCTAVRRVVNECADASFAATGEKFNPDTDLIDVPHEEPSWDKHPEFLPMLPRTNKREMFRRAAQHGVTSSAKYDLAITGREHAGIVLSAPGLPEPLRFSLALDLPPQPNMMPGAPHPHVPVGSAYVSPPGMPYNGAHSPEPTPIDPYRGLPENVREVFRADEARLRTQFPDPGATPADNWHAAWPNAFSQASGSASHASIDPWTGQSLGARANYSTYADPFAEQKERIRRQNEELERKRQEELHRRRTEQVTMMQTVYASANGADLRPALTEPGDRYARLHPRNALPTIEDSRNYMAGVGLFLSRAGFEQVGAGEHPYGYARNNPLRFTDATGRQPDPVPPPSRPGVWYCVAHGYGGHWHPTHFFISTSRCGAWGSSGFPIYGLVQSIDNLLEPLPGFPGYHIPGKGASDNNVDCHLVSRDPAYEKKVCDCIFGPGFYDFGGNLRQTRGLCNNWVNAVFACANGTWDRVGRNNDAGHYRSGGVP